MTVILFIRTCTAFVPDCTGLYRSSTLFNHFQLYFLHIFPVFLHIFPIFNSISSIFLLFSTIFFLLDGSKLKARRGAGLKRVFALVLLLFIAEARWRVASFLLLALSLVRSGFLGGKTRQISKKKGAFFHEGAWRVVPPALPCR